MHAIAAALGAVTPAEWVGSVLALAYLVLAARESPWCWSFAILSSAVSLWVFAHAALPMQAALQAFYVAMAVYGWHAWRRGDHGEALAVTRWPARYHAVAICGIGVATLAIGVAASPDRGSVVPYVDSLIACGSVVATFMVTRKVLENWLYWIVLDGLAVALYWVQHLPVFALLFVLYVAIAIRGYVLWRASLSDPAGLRGRVANA